MGILASNMSSVQAGGMGIEIEMDPSPVLLVAAWDKLGLDIRSFRVPLERSVRQVIGPSLKTNFDVGGRPQWEFLSPDYAAKRERKKSTRGMIGSSGAVTSGSFEGSIMGVANVLVLSGRLARTAGQLRIWDIDGLEGLATLSLPADVWYGAIHQEGHHPVPQREWAVFQPEDLDDIEKVFADWMEERVEDAALGRRAARI
jgi:phage gpG-like protein